MRTLNLLCAALLFSVGCEKPLDADKGKAENRPSLVFEGFQAFGTRGQVREWKALAEKAEVYNERHLAVAQNLQLDYYQKGKVISVLKADRGEIDTETQNVMAEGNVVLRADNGVVLKTSQLAWDHSKEQIHTQKAVRVYRKDTVMTGIGLISDRNLGSVEVLKDVRIVARSVESLREMGAEFDTSRP